MKKIFLIITAMLALSFSSKADNLRILAEAGDEATLTAAIAQFEEANPGVTVEASYLGWDDFMSTIKLKMAVITSINILALYSNSEAREVCKNFL